MSDVRAFLAAADPVLHAATADLEPLPIYRPRAPDEALLRAIVGQQLSTRAAATIWGRIVARYGDPLLPAALVGADPVALRALGLSHRKVEYVLAVADAARSGLLRPEDLQDLDDDAVIARLVAIRGVGRWTAEMILMFSLQRPDVFAVGDHGLRQAMVGIYGWTATGRALDELRVAHARRWAPHRTTASRLLWAWLNARPRGPTRA